MNDRERIRIELRVSRAMVDLADEFADVIGLRRNAFFVLAASKLVAEWMILYARMPGAKRDVYFKILEKEVLEALEGARKAL
jgi:uncharacterized protein (DUF1778 family)